MLIFDNSSLTCVEDSDVDEKNGFRGLASGRNPPTTISDLQSSKTGSRCRNLELPEVSNSIRTGTAVSYPDLKGSITPTMGIGQADQADTLGDAGGTAGWQDEFKPGNGMHGVMLIASDDVDAVNNQASSLIATFDNSIVEVYRLLGQARPGAEAGHERELPGLFDFFFFLTCVAP
jgi:hypothetical protein